MNHGRQSINHGRKSINHGTKTEVLDLFMKMMPLERNAIGHGPVDAAVVGSRARKNGENFHFNIGPRDCLIVVDFQNDFVPLDKENLHGGRLGAEEAADIVDPIKNLIDQFMKDGGVVVATRDYHPIDHCSFAGHGGAMPKHCVQGTYGSQFYRPLAQKFEGILKNKKLSDRFMIAYKAYHEDIDSFGALPYSKTYCNCRGNQKGMHALPQHDRIDVSKPERVMPMLLPNKPKPGHFVEKTEFTGGIVLKCSGQYFDGHADANAPPDIRAYCKGVKLEDKLHAMGVQRVFVCGLVTDYCVLDTACNAKKAGFNETFLIIDASRPSSVRPSAEFTPPFGGRFLQDPSQVKKTVVENGGKFCFTQDIVRRGGTFRN